MGTAVIAPWSMPAAQQLLPASAAREQWLDARVEGIGGSDIPAIVGLSEWKTRYGVFCDKVGIDEGEDDNDAMEWGRRLEGPLADWFTDHTGIPTRRVGLVRSKAQPLALASIDRLTDCTGKCAQPDGILECKTTSWRQAEQWADDQTPDAAELQTVWYLGVTGRSHAHVVVLIDGREPLQRTVQANPSLYATLLQAAVEFWESYVVPGHQPPITMPHGAVLDEVKRLFPNVEVERKVAAATDVDEMLFGLKSSKMAVKIAKAQEEFWAAKVRDFIGDAAELVTEGTVRATCKTVNAKPFNQKAFEEDHPDLFAEYKMPRPYRTLLLKDKD
jgi:putative phage-type endonuclease